MRWRWMPVDVPVDGGGGVLCLGGWGNSLPSCKVPVGHVCLGILIWLGHWLTTGNAQKFQSLETEGTLPVIFQLVIICLGR